MRQGLVLAGGGDAAMAWELGVLLGLRDEAPNAHIIDADVIVGTSAGSVVAVQITSGTDLAVLFDAQLSGDFDETEVEMDRAELAARFEQASAGARGVEQIRRRVGQVAIEAPTVTEEDRRADIAAMLPVAAWPDGTLLIPAVDAESGEPSVFTKDSGVDLVDAVTASNAVPGVWPPATINGRRYIDGGVRSVMNADLAEGCQRVLIITPSRPGDTQLWGDLGEEVILLEGAETRVIYADDTSIAAFGANRLSPSSRPASAADGRRVGRARAAEIAAFWR